MAGHVLQSRRLRLAAMCIVTSCVAAVGAGATNGTAAQPAPRVILYGDSLSAQASPEVVHDLTDRGQARLEVNAAAGTAPCDWLPQMLKDARSSSTDVAVIQFSGNNFGCMNYVPGSEAFYGAYTEQVAAATRAFAARDIHVFLIGSPIPLNAVVSADRHWDRLNQIYARIAADTTNTTFVNAGAALDPNGRFTWTLPCLPAEPTCSSQGRVVVRAYDGAHFCPQQAGDGSQCLDYSSGAVRFAAAVTAPVNAYLAGQRLGDFVGPRLPQPNTLPTMAPGQSATATPYSGIHDALTPGQFLFAQESIQSISGLYRLTLQSNGNLVLDGPPGPIWSSNTAGSGANLLTVLPNGNVALFNGSKPIWTTHTAGTPANYFGVQDNGELALYHFNTLFWQTSPVTRTSR